MDYIPKYFQLHELVPEKIYRQYENEQYKLWWVFDPRLLKAHDLMRQRYGRMVANTWYWGGKHQYRGWRPPECIYGSRLSQHRFGRALDTVPLDVTVEEIRTDIIGGENFLYITEIELDVAWLHAGCRNYRGLLQFAKSN